jgi:hypothetical protein
MAVAWRIQEKLFPENSGRYFSAPSRCFLSVPKK